MDLNLKRPWFGLVVFLCIAMIPSESGDSCVANVKLQSKTLMRLIQVIMAKGNILQNMVEKAMKSGDNNKMIKGIKGLKIIYLGIPSTSITFKPNDMAVIEVTINITVAGKSFIGGSMQINVMGNMNIMVKVSKCPSGKLLLKVTECKVKVLSCKTNLPSSMLPKIVNKFLDSTLGKVMPGVLCPAADMMMEQTMITFERILQKKPIGSIGYIWYEVSAKPLVYTNYISFDIKIKIENKKGEIVWIESDSLPDNLPPCKGTMSAIYVPECALNVILVLIQPLLKADLTKVKGSVPTSDQLKKILPNVGLPAGKKMKIQITHTASPTVTLLASGASLITYTEVFFFDMKTSKKLLSIKMKQKFSVLVLIEKEQMTLNLKAGSCKTMEISSTAGDVTAAKEYMETTMENHVPHCNGVFNKNWVPLPTIMNATSTSHDPELNLVDKHLMLHLNVEPFTSEEMAQEVKKQCSAIKL